MESTQRSSGRRPHKVRCAQDAQVWASLAALPCSSLPPLAFGHLPLTGGVVLSPQNPLRWAFVGAPVGSFYVSCRARCLIGPRGSLGAEPPIPKTGGWAVLRSPCKGRALALRSLPPSKPSVLPPPSSEGGLAGGSYPPLRCVTFMGFCRARCPHRAYSCSGSICVPSEDAVKSPTWCGSFPLPKDEGVDVVLPLN